MFYAPVLAIVQSLHTELRRSRSTSTRHLLVPVVLADNMPPLQNPLYNIGWVEEFRTGIYHVTMFQLHPGSIYVSSFSIIHPGLQDLHEYAASPFHHCCTHLRCDVHQQCFGFNMTWEPGGFQT